MEKALLGKWPSLLTCNNHIQATVQVDLYYLVFALRTAGFCCSKHLCHTHTPLVVIPLGLTIQKNDVNIKSTLFHYPYWPFLADRTIGRAYGTVCRLSSVVCLSVCLSSVTFCIVAKRCVLAKKCLKEWIGNQGQRIDFLGRRHISTSGFAATATQTAVFALFLPIQPSNRY